MAFRHINELPLGDKIFRVELASDDDITVTLTLTGWREAAPLTPLAGGSLTMPLADVPTLRIALNRGLRALALAADVAEPIPDRDILRELFPGHGAPWIPQHEEDLTQRFHAGETIARIAARFGRTPDSVRTKLRELGHDPRRPEHCPPDGCLSWSRYASPAMLGAAQEQAAGTAS
ncbi:wHTH domain-containing protein [Streptomyces xiamenensis]|uniref:wHTH domain-containing protein n=1 Tax=Streptomyces xiamenensis TaxID=408015 RepID=UPI00367E70BA